MNRIYTELLQISSVKTTRQTKTRIDESAKYVHKIGKEST